MEGGAGWLETASEGKEQARGGWQASLACSTHAREKVFLNFPEQIISLSKCRYSVLSAALKKQQQMQISKSKVFLLL